MKRPTIGQKILAAIISEQLGISVDRALKHHVLPIPIHPSWEKLGEDLLKKSAAGSWPPTDSPAEETKAERTN